MMKPKNEEPMPVILRVMEFLSIPWIIMLKCHAFVAYVNPISPGEGGGTKCPHPFNIAIVIFF